MARVATAKIPAAWTRVVISMTLLLLAGLWMRAMAAENMAEEKPQREPPPSAERGAELAERFCSSCHVISSSADSTVTAGVPTFRSIANKPGQTADRIRSSLIQPHPPMPQPPLSVKEMDSIVRYLDTMRDGETKPLLPPAVEEDKPIYPEPS